MLFMLIRMSPFEIGKRVAISVYFREESKRDGGVEVLSTGKCFIFIV